jgi:hypothetical protein
MKNSLFFLAAFLVATPANADIHHTISASASLTTTAAATQATRVGSSFSISGTGVDTAIGDNAGQLSAGTITSGIYSPGTVVATQNSSNGEAYSFSSTYLQGDVVPTSALTTGASPNFSDIVSTAAGSAGDAAATLTSAQAVGLTAGGPGSQVVGQIISEIKITD